MKKSDIQIFLAHSTEDKPQVRELYNLLEQEGYSPWLDDMHLPGGGVWEDEISKAIKKSTLFIACLSEQSLAKEGYVHKEIRLALTHYAELLDGNIYIIPLKLDECQIPDFRQHDYGIKLTNFQWIDYHKNDGFKKLIRVIEDKRIPQDKNNKTPLPNHQQYVPPVSQTSFQNEKVKSNTSNSSFSNPNKVLGYGFLGGTIAFLLGVITGEDHHHH